MTIQTLLTNARQRIAAVPRKAWVFGGVGLAVGIYALVFFVPKSVEFSYAGETCVGQFTIAPGIHKGSSPDFSVSYADEVRLGSVTLFSRKTCIMPTTAPQEGSHMVSSAPFGGVIARKHFAVHVPEAPKAHINDIIGKVISAARPLTIKLSATDKLHTYNLQVADKRVVCTPKDTLLSCNIKSLDLDQGASYQIALYRSFKENNQKVGEGEVETLRALQLTDASIKNDQTIYDKPTSVTFVFDQPVADSTVKLYKINGDTQEEVRATQTHEDASLIVAFDELPRESQYKLELQEVVAHNGSALDGPVIVSFQTSGGPKVTGVSVGASGVSRTARILVTFDQPIDSEVDIAKLARAEGVAASVSRASDTQIAFTIQGGDCAAFSLVIDKGIKSGSNGELSKEPWKFTSRTVCGTSWVIGYSLKGRPITAYSFGSGGTVILFTAAIHGSEISSYTTMMAWVTYLQQNAASVIPANKRIVIVPNTNPDGVAAGTRNNSRNVNVGRNFPTGNWSASIETASGTLPTGGGTSSGSEPEAAALITLTRQLRPRLEVSFHAQGSLVGANKYGDSVAIGNMYAQTVGYQTMYYNAEEVMGYAMTGEYEDWMGEEMGIPAILIELPRLSGNYFNSQLPALKKLLNL